MEIQGPWSLVELGRANPHGRDTGLLGAGGDPDPDHSGGLHPGPIVGGSSSAAKSLPLFPCPVAHPLDWVLTATLGLTRWVGTRSELILGAGRSVARGCPSPGAWHGPAWSPLQGEGPIQDPVGLLVKRAHWVPRMGLRRDPATNAFFRWPLPLPACRVLGLGLVI